MATHWAMLEFFSY
jgi:hypothetical protein